MLRAEGGEIDFQLRAFCDFYAGEEIKSVRGRPSFSLCSRFLPFTSSAIKSKTNATCSLLLINFVARIDCFHQIPIQTNLHVKIRMKNNADVNSGEHSIFYLRCTWPIFFSPSEINDTGD